MRRDATVATAVRAIEKVFGLPSGSVSIRLPNGTKARSDKSIQSLLADYTP
jgi:hypothetical protein